MQAVVLAGGLATRMHPETLTVAKSMIEVCERPFVDWQLELLARHGYREVVLCVGHFGDQIQAHVGDGARFGLDVRFVFDGPTLLGTWGALRAAAEVLEPTFLVTYGDSFLPFDYAAPLRMLEAHEDCDAVMTVYENEGRWDTSNVETDGVWVRRYEKRGAAAPAVCDGSAAPATNDALRFIDYGALAFRRHVVCELPSGTAAGLDVLQSDLARRRRLRALLATERFFEIGSREGLAGLAERLRSMQQGREEP